MLRRNARLRKEFLYRKSLEGKEKELYEKKRKIRQALEGARCGWLGNKCRAVQQGSGWQRAAATWRWC